MRRSLPRTAREHLDISGSFVFDVESASAFAGAREQAACAPELVDGFWSARPRFGSHNTCRCDGECVSLDTYEIFEADRHRTLLDWVRYFTPAELVAELCDAGFGEVDILGDLTGATHDGDAPRFAAVARRGR
ncbi:hypothetical protein [Streptomyces sp. NPDC001741]|uniref:hypothetical protein n=1 Tax=Streptomyces sp. NPDC001741 TaxID=3364605 RepID=UPI0036B746EC